jgi:hypothetical protein
LHNFKKNKNPDYEPKPGTKEYALRVKLSFIVFSEPLVTGQNQFFGFRDEAAKVLYT